MKHYITVSTITTLFFCTISLVNIQIESKIFQNGIVVMVNPKGQSFIGKDTFDMEGLSHELQQRFWKSYLGTGKMQDELKLEVTGNVPSATVKAVIAAIRKGQQDALVDLSLQLHKKRFEDLSSKQQKKIKTKYPILFQQKFY